MPSPIMRYFAYAHLPAGPLRDTSVAVCGLAELMDATLPDGAEKSTGLRKLLEAKDAFVRAALDITIPVKTTEQPYRCACIGHRIPGVFHMAPCCDEPHVDSAPTKGELPVT